MPKTRSLNELLVQISQFKGGVKPGYALLLGAGASKQSGVPLARELEQEAISELFVAHEPPDPAEPRAETAVRARAWAENLDWFRNRSGNTYQAVMENAFLSPGARQQFLRRRVLLPGLSFGYRQLAQLLKAKIFDTVFTTNFDHLVRRGCEGLLDQPLKEVLSIAQYPIEEPSPSDPRLIRMHGDFYHGNVLNSEGEMEQVPQERTHAAYRLLQNNGLVVIGYGGNDQTIMADLLYDHIHDAHFLRNGLLWCVLPGQEVPYRVHALVERSKKHPRVSIIEIPGFDETMSALVRHLDVEAAEPDWNRRLKFSWSMHNLIGRLIDLCYAPLLNHEQLISDLGAQFRILTGHLRRSEGALILDTRSGWKVVAADGFLRNEEIVDLSGAAWYAKVAREQKQICFSKIDSANDTVLKVLHEKKIEAVPVWREGQLRMLAIFAGEQLMDSESDDFPIAQNALRLFSLASERIEGNTRP